MNHTHNLLTLIAAIGLVGVACAALRALVAHSTTTGTRWAAVTRQAVR